MKLRTKLLLGVGLLLFAMVIVMVILPTFFVRKDVFRAADQIHELLIDDHRQLIKSQQIWLDNVLGRTEQNINSILFMLYEEPTFSDMLSFGTQKSLVKIWDAMARVTSYDPEIGFVQAHSPEQNQAAVISPHTGALYPVAKIIKYKELDLVALHDPEANENQETIFVGMPLPEELQTEAGYQLYALMDVKNFKEEEKEIQEEIAHLKPMMVQEQLEDTKQLVFSHIEENVPAYFWAIKIDLIRALAPLVVEGLLLQQDAGRKMIPTGMARLDTSGNGLAILSETVFQTTPLFDDQLYYERHAPKPKAPPLADGTALITKEKGNHAFVGNTLLIKDTFLTIGFPLSHLAKQLALSSNKIILLRVKNAFWIGFDGEGNKLPSDRIKAIVNSGLLNQRRGELSVDKKSFFFARISALADDDLVFYELHPMGREQSIIGTLLELEDRLSERISLQLSIISLGTMVLVLFFIGRIGFSVISPITKLAQATEEVVEGRYDEVVLPEMGNRRDEVAILTRSFGEMVRGLEEREKIRGVLDKVVSKDVADEILRTQIHLGGEDRIVTMLFADIRDFAEISENTTPQKTIRMLNGCMTKISRVIEGEGGVIDKYVGDEVMAIFGAPTHPPDHALRAVSSGMLIVETLKRWNQERAKENAPLLEMGIGIHTGLVVVGNMGAEDRLNYTVLGSNVNLASRLCEVAKPNQLIISKATLAEPNIEESFFVKPLEPISLKGFKEPVSIYEVVSFKWDES